MGLAVIGLASAGENFLRLIVVFIIFVGVLILTYYTTKWVANYQKHRIVHRNLEILETMQITTGKYIQIIRVGKDSYFVVGIGKEELTMLGEVSADELDLSVYDAGDVSGDAPKLRFKSVLESFKEQLPKK